MKEPRQHGLCLDSHTRGGPAAGHAPQRVLVEALADDLQIVSSAEEHDLDGRLGVYGRRS
jgi:hypothetical protein